MEQTLSPTASPRVWLMAIRPKTLPAALAPVSVGTALAASDGMFAAGPFLAALAGALLLQIGVNLANDYFDFVKGIDTERRLGPVRVTQSGLLAPQQVRTAMWVVFGMAAAAGGYLVAVAGWPIAVVGAASMASALAYSGGPYPLASHGFGDVFAFIFFGPVAVAGTYFVQALRLTPDALLVSLPLGCLVTAILVVNNLRDIDTDAAAGKSTLAVKQGRRKTRIEYVLLVVIAYLIPPWMWVAGRLDAWAFLPFLSLPLAGHLFRSVCRQQGRALNSALARTAALTLAFSALLAAALLLCV